jgi:hypothetical protein
MARRQYSAGTVRPTLREAADAAIGTYVRAPALPGVKTPVTQRRGWQTRQRHLEASLGEKAAAAAAGVTPRTWRTWMASVKPTARSLAGLQGAYERDLEAQSQTLPRRKAEARRLAAGGRQAYVVVWAEIQWSGYYNGQADRRGGPSVAVYEADPPEPGNRDAHRGLVAGHGGQVALGELLRIWSAGRDTGRELDRMMNDEYIGLNQRPELFLNTYYKAARVQISDTQISGE